MYDETLNGNFPNKKIQLDQEDWSSFLIEVVKPFYERVNKQNAVLKTGYQDAPYFPAAISLGAENMKNAPIYKINAPGYFYRQHYKGAWTSEAIAGVVVSDSPARLLNKDTRMVYLAGSDGSVGHANNLYPILPGSSTYAYIVRSSIADAAVTREWCFVPTVFAACVNIHPDSFVVPVGTPNNTTKPDLTGAGGIISSAFTGNWKLSFKSVCGWNVASEDDVWNTGVKVSNGMQFMTETDRENFVTARKNWITGLGAKLADHGYGTPTTPTT